MLVSGLVILNPNLTEVFAVFLSTNYKTFPTGTAIHQVSTALVNPKGLTISQLSFKRLSVNEHNYTVLPRPTCLGHGGCHRIV
eukprot:2309297-Amphidinium_carterae.1